MGYLPVFIDVSGRTCVVIGGGEVAERKTLSLIEAGALVVLISPEVTAGLAAMSRSAIRHLAREYRRGDLAGARLAFEATGDDVTARAVASEAGELSVPVNVADVPELCTFIAPAVVQRGGLQIAISTGGASPALAGKIRQELEDRFGHEYEVMVDLLAHLRRWLRIHQPDRGLRAHTLGALVQSDLLQCLKRGDFAAANAIVEKVLGRGLAEIGFEATRITRGAGHDPAMSNEPH